VLVVKSLGITELFVRLLRYGRNDYDLNGTRDATVINIAQHTNTCGSNTRVPCRESKLVDTFNASLTYRISINEWLYFKVNFH